MSAEDPFDAVTRAAAEGVSRRQIVRMLAGAIAGGTLLTGFTRPLAWGATNPCVARCALYPAGQRRAECRRACNQCRARGGQFCQGGSGHACCESDDRCCTTNVDQICCPPGSRCCDSRGGSLNCCPESTECCGAHCCAPGQCCRSTVFLLATCCPPGETCCFDPDLSPPDTRCGTIDPTTGNCVPV